MTLNAETSGTTGAGGAGGTNGAGATGGGQAGQSGGAGLLSLVGEAERAAGAQQQNGQQQNGQQQPAGIGHNGGPEWMPEGVPEGLRGKDAKETITKLLGAVAQPPAKADDYKLELAPDVQRVVGDLADDKVLGMFRKIAHDAKLSPAQFNGVVGKFLATMSEEGLIEPVVDPEGELMKLAPRRGAPDERRTDALRRVAAAQGTLKRLQADKTLSSTEYNILNAVLVTAEGVTAIEKISGLIAERGPQTTGGSGAAAPVQSDDQRRLAVLYPSMKSAS